MVALLLPFEVSVLRMRQYIIPMNTQQNKCEKSDKNNVFQMNALRISHRHTNIIHAFTAMVRFVDLCY